MSYRPLIASVVTFAALRGLAALGWGAVPQAGLPGGVIVGLGFADLIVLALSGAWVWRNLYRGFGGSGLIVRVICAGVFTWSGAMVLTHMGGAAGPPDAPAPPVRSLPVRGGTIEIAGPIDFETFEALARALSGGTDLGQLVLDSGGGRIPAARGLARLVAEAGLDTHVEGTCASACVLVYAAGQNRSLGAQGRLGFHGYKLISVIETIDPQTEQARDAAFYVARGIDAEFIARALSVPHDEMWFPDRSELRAAGVVNRD